MASVSFQNVEKAFGSTRVIHGVSFDIQDGEFMVLVGPSGCGKSTLLRVVSGLEQADAGRVLYDGRDMQGVAPGDRGIGMVFQNYALFPHMTVNENLAFPLQVRGKSRAEITERITLKDENTLEIEGVTVAPDALTEADRRTRIYKRLPKTMPAVADQMAKRRLAEVQQTGGGMVVTSCATCAFML